jgi:hypothetical protein
VEASGSGHVFAHRKTDEKTILLMNEFVTTTKVPRWIGTCDTRLARRIEGVILYFKLDYRNLVVKKIDCYEQQVFSFPAIERREQVLHY